MITWDSILSKPRPCSSRASLDAVIEIAQLASNGHAPISTAFDDWHQLEVNGKFWFFINDRIEPFEAGFDQIVVDQRLAYEFALNVLKGPFPAGEPIIATPIYDEAGNPNFVYIAAYAMYVLNAAFPEGVRVIMKHLKAN